MCSGLLANDKKTRFYEYLCLLSEFQWNLNIRVSKTVTEIQREPEVRRRRYQIEYVLVSSLSIPEIERDRGRLINEWIFQWKVRTLNFRIAIIFWTSENKNIQIIIMNTICTK